MHRVVHEEDVPARLFHSRPPLSPGDLSVRTLIDEAAGSRNLLQRVLRLRGEAQFEPRVVGEEVLYVAQGSAWLSTEPAGGGDPLWPGSAVFVPPGTEYRLTNAGSDPLLVISVLSPPPDSRSIDGAPSDRWLRLVREEDEESVPAGDDRHFKLLVDIRHGSRQVTQFVGFIERGAAPPHTHTYEEAIYVLAGQGVVHVEDRNQPIRPGSSIFLSPGTPHCLENQGQDVLKVLGVFSPPGSPASKAESPT
jgi:mannose-6-phosphate isomerase-like protein (cupin superfamily)